MNHEADRLRTLHDALEAHPDVTVVAIAPNGLLTTPPADLNLRGRAPLAGRTTMEVVVPEDMGLVIETFERALAEGESAGTVRMPAPGGTGTVLTTVCYFDLRQTYGLIIGMFLPGPTVDAADVPNEQSRPVSTRPRVARLFKNGLAVITDVDDNALTLFGYERDELVGRRTLELVHPDDHQAAIRAWVEMLEHPGLARQTQLRHLRADGSWMWLEVTNVNRLSDAEPMVLSDVVDISAEKAAEEELGRRERQLHQIAESLPLGLLQADLSGVVQYTNGRLSRLLGRPSGTQLAQHLGCLRRDHRERLMSIIADVGRLGVDGDLEVELLPNGGEQDSFGVRRVLHVGLRPLSRTDERPDGIIASFSDVTEAVQMRRALEAQATIDTLTGCLTRAELVRRLHRCLAEATAGTAAVFIDMDGLKSLNDTLGHRCGDEVLRQLGQHLLSERRRAQEVGRLGGDEFLVLIPSIADQATAEIVGRRIASGLQGLSVVAGGSPVPLQCSVGISWSAPGAKDADQLVAEADAGMYASKRAGQGRAVSFEDLVSGVPLTAAAEQEIASSA